MSGKPAATDPIPLTLAARSAGIPARTLRNWIASGKLAAIRGQRGWLVRIADIAHITATIDNHAASGQMADGMADELAATLAADSGDAAIPARQLAIAAIDQRLAAEALVQQILAPFIAEQTRLAEELGRVRAERDQKDETIAELQRRAEVAETELVREREAAAASAEANRRRLEQERRNREALEAAQAAQDAPGAPETPEEASQGLWARLGRWWRG